MATCFWCGGAFNAPARNRAKRYCSVLCRSRGAGRSISVAKVKSEPSIHASGYRVRHVPLDHISRQAGNHKRRRRAFEHTMIAEEVLGRPLKKGEVVHHINGDKLDNRKTNLLICTRSYHNALHARMSERYQREKFGRVA